MPSGSSSSSPSASGSRSARARERGGGARRASAALTLRDELAADRRVPLTAAELDAAFVPGTYMGAAEVFIDRALELYRR